MQFKRLRSLTFLLLVLSCHTLMGQNGIIRGTIIDDENAEPLFAANAGIKGTSIGASADFDGNFELNADPGTYTLTVSFIGYQQINISDVVVKANEVTNLEVIRLKSSAIAVDVVTVTAEATKNTETALLTIKKKSVNVIDGISSQNFKKMGDGNAAAAVTRVPGVSVQGGKYVYVRGLGDRYTKTMFNGLDIPGLDPDRNSLQMDIFPTNVIDNIIVLKSFTADLPADFTGGVVDIATKSFPETPTLNVSTKLGFNPNMHFNPNFLTYKGGKYDVLGFDDGSRDLPLSDPKIEIVSPRPAFGSYEETMNITRSFNPIMATERNHSFLNSSFSVSGGNQLKRNGKNYGFNGALSYRNNSSFFKDRVQNSFEKNSNQSINKLITSREQIGDVGENNVLLSAMFGGAMKTLQSKYKINILHLQNAQKRAGFMFENNYESNFNSMKKENLEYSERSISNLLIGGTHNYDEGKWKLDWKISPTYSKIRDKDIRESAYEMNIENGDTTYLIDISNAGTPSRMWRNLNEYNIASKIDVTREHELFNFDAKLKFGTSYSFKYRDYDILRYLILPVNLSSQFTGNPNELLTDLIYTDTEDAGFYIRGEYQASNTYEGIKSNFSTYISEEFQITDQLKSITGIRLEYFEQFYTGQNQGGTIIYNNEKVLSDVGIFPTTGLIYSLNKNTNLRASAFRTTARPSFKEKSNAQILDVLSGLTFNGNIDLIQTDINNLDFRYEHFGNRNKTIALSGFYKQLINPIELVAYSSDEDNIQPKNSGDANVIGLELETRTALGFINDKLFVNFNGSVIESQVNITGDEYESRKNNLRDGEEFSEVRNMQGQAPFLVNTGVSFKDIDKKLEAGLFYNVQGPTLSIVGINKRPDIYSAPFHSLNLNILTQIGKEDKLQLSFKINNILDSKRELLTQSYGIESSVFSSFSPGRTFSLKLSYALN